MFYSRAAFYAGFMFQREYINPESCMIRMNLENPSSCMKYMVMYVCMYTAQHDVHTVDKTQCAIRAGSETDIRGSCMPCGIACAIDIFSFFF